MIDPENIRVDLLKFRRKAFLSYPYNSPERKNFLKVILQNELMLAGNEVPQDMIHLAISGKNTVFKESIKRFLGWFGASALCCLAFALTVHHSLLALAFLSWGGIFMYLGLQRLAAYISYHKNLKIVEKYSNEMKNYMNKLYNDIKRLG
jgi:hypothetical protein